jgi:hypothetical protein
MTGFAVTRCRDASAASGGAAQAIGVGTSLGSAGAAVEDAIAGMPNAGSSDSSSANCPKLVFHQDGGTAKLPRRQSPAKSR